MADLIVALITAIGMVVVAGTIVNVRREIRAIYAARDARLATIQAAQDARIARIHRDFHQTMDDLNAPHCCTAAPQEDPVPESYFARENATFAGRRNLIRIKPHIWAVIDTATGGYYGVVESDPVWGARDWEGLSLNVPDSNYHSRDTTPAAWANRLIDRADKAGGLPQAEAPELALGIIGDFLYMPTGNSRRFNLYTASGTFLGRVGTDGTAWYAERKADTGTDGWVTVATDVTREQVATALQEDAQRS